MYQDALLLNLLPRHVQMAVTRSSPLSADLDTVTLCFALFHLLGDGELRCHERLSNGLQSQLFTPEAPLLLPLLLNDLTLDLTLCHFARGRDCAVQVKPYVLAICLDFFDQLLQHTWLCKCFFETIKLEVGAEVDILRNKVHRNESFLNFFNAVSEENSTFETLLKSELELDDGVEQLPIVLLTVARSDD